jgi:hypothetical protein
LAGDREQEERPLKFLCVCEKKSAFENGPSCLMIPLLI